MNPRQQLALAYITGFHEAHNGISPAMEDVAEGIGLSRGSKSPAHKVLVELERLGHIRRLPKLARAIEVLTPVEIPRGPSGEPLFFVAVR